jgi:glutamate-1-semialdehyde 2,1-aminomutase
MAPARFLQGVRALASATGAVLIVDEISAGFRMNTGGAHLVLGMEPTWPFFPKPGERLSHGCDSREDAVMDAAQRSFISSLLDGEDRPRCCPGDDENAPPAGCGKAPDGDGADGSEGWRTLFARHGLAVHSVAFRPWGISNSNMKRPWC